MQGSIVEDTGADRCALHGEPVSSSEPVTMRPVANQVRSAGEFEPEEPFSVVGPEDSWLRYKIVATLSEESGVVAHQPLPNAELKPINVSLAEKQRS